MSKIKNYESKVKSAYPEINDIQDDLSSLKANTVELARHVQADGMEQAAEFSEKTHEFYQEIKERGATEFQKIEERVRNKPAQSLAIAFVAGLVTSALFGRR